MPLCSILSDQIELWMVSVEIQMDGKRRNSDECNGEISYLRIDIYQRETLPALQTLMMSADFLILPEETQAKS